MPLVLVRNRSDSITINNTTPQGRCQTILIGFLQDQRMSTRYLASKKHSVTLGEEILIINILQAV